jgi:hypothetical protein
MPEYIDVVRQPDGAYFAFTPDRVVRRVTSWLDVSQLRRAYDVDDRFPNSSDFSAFVGLVGPPEPLLLT